MFLGDPSVGMMGGGFEVKGVDFNGTTNYLNRGANYTGAADYKKGVISVWVNPSTTGRSVIGDQTSGGTGYFQCQLGSSGELYFAVYVAPSPIAVQLYSNNGAIAQNQWNHILVSWDCVNSIAHLFINDVQSEATKVVNNHAATVTRTERFVGLGGGLSGYWQGGMAQVYMDDANYLDLTVTANRRKFNDGAGGPVDLGATGQLPSGSNPILYLNVATSAADFNTNKAVGGGLTVNGAALTLSATPVHQ